MSQAPFGHIPPGQPNWPAPETSPPRGNSRLPIVAAIAISVIAIAIAVGSWFRPIPKAEPPAPRTYSAQEVADAKRAVCGAYEKVHRALNATGRKNGGADQASTLAVAVNIRLALVESSRLLLQTLQESGATPTDITESVKGMAVAFQNIAMDQLGEAPQSELDPLFKEVDMTDLQIKQACQ